MKRHIQIIAAIFLFLLAIGPIQAQGTIQYPISNLGNCTNEASCYTYCSVLEHEPACEQFAQSAGLPYQGTTSLLSRLLISAKSSLGCGDFASCKSYCDEPNNYASCLLFSLQNKLPQVVQAIDALPQTAMHAAQSILGCDSAATCAAYCNKASAYTQCSLFAQMYTSTTTTTNNGTPQSSQKQFSFVQVCNSVQGCKTLCKQNNALCSSIDMNTFSIPIQLPFIPTQLSLPSQTGPGGCIFGTTCASYCQDHMNECIKFYTSITNESIPNISSLSIPSLAFSIPTLHFSIP